MPRALVLNHNLIGMGTYHRAWAAARELARRGWDVTFATTGAGWYRPRRSRRDGVECWETPSASLEYGPDGGWAPLGVGVRAWLAVSRKRDLVWSFSHRPVDSIPARLARAIRGATWVCDWNDLYGGGGILAMQTASAGSLGPLRELRRRTCDRIDARLEERCARRCDLLTVISGFLADRARGLGVPQSRILRVWNGAGIEGIAPLDRAECRRSLGLGEDGVLLGYLANYHPDQAMMLDALAIVHRERPAIGFISAGTALYGGGEELARRGIGSMVRQLGRLPDDALPHFLGAMDVMLVPTTETLFNRSRVPHKVGDAMAAARAQVSCAVGDIPELFSRGGFGVASRPEAGDFAAAIIALADDAPRREAMGAAGRRAAEEWMNWPAAVDAVLARLVSLA